MATWTTVCRTRQGSATLGLTSDKSNAKETRSWSPNYLAIAADGTDPNTLSEVDAMRAPGIPILKRDVFVSEDGLIFPYFSCKSKSCDRDEANPLMFHVSCEFEDDSGDDGQGVQENVEDYSPSIRWSIKSRQRSSWTDINGKPYVLPTGSKYKQPLMIDYPCRVAQVTQLELTFDDLTMKNRMLRLNTQTWQGIPPGEALLTNISYEEVLVPVGIGFIQSYQLAYRVTYTIEENDLVVTSGNGVPPVNPAAGATVQTAVGWDQMRPRIDSICKMPDGTIRTASSINPILTSVYLQSNGLFWTGPVNPDFPQLPAPVDVYQVYDSTNFSLFLRI